MAVQTDLLKLQIKGPIAHLILNHPHRRNAMNSAMWATLRDHCDVLAVENSVKLVVLRSSDPTFFSAGADISEFSGLSEDRDAASAYARSIANAVDALSSLSQPTVACINGDCFGGANALTLACDFRLAAHDARFAITPARLGLTYSIEDTARLASTVGIQQARRMLMRAEVVDAQIALRHQLVDQLAPTGYQAEDILEEFTSPLLNLSHRSIRDLKASLQQVLAGQRSDEADSIKAFVDAFSSNDHLEGRAAFLEKRKADFPSQR